MVSLSFKRVVSKPESERADQFYETDLTVVYELLRVLFLLFVKLGTSMFCLLLWNRKQEFFSGLVAKLTVLLAN